MGSPVESNCDFAICDSELRWHIDEIAEDLAGLSIVVTTLPTGHDATEAASVLEKFRIGPGRIVTADQETFRRSMVGGRSSVRTSGRVDRRR
jgi:hypothetical protein